MTVKIIAELLAEAIENCVTCDGTGWRVPPSTSDVGGVWNARYCMDCQGGKVLTTEGYALVDFAATWLGPKFAEADHGHSLH